VAEGQIELPAAVGAQLDDLERRVLDGQGVLAPAVRRAAAGGGDVPDDVAAYTAKVRRNAYRVTDEEVAGLQSRGWSDDQLFELTVAAAYGAARERLEAGLEALAGADRPAGDDEQEEEPA
jgi:alkylhydroperoxidase family enzyme